MKLKISNTTELYMLQTALLVFSSFARVEKFEKLEKEVQDALQNQYNLCRNLLKRSQQPNFTINSAEELHLVQKAINKAVEIENLPDFEPLQKTLTQGVAENNLLPK
ncbi:MAG: hypothetical protein R3279_12580 [Putridiphycobacter sp.]|nr:hypothetical protein [Putridiphycobacter sp.]